MRRSGCGIAGVALLTACVPAGVQRAPEPSPPPIQPPLPAMAAVAAPPAPPPPWIARRVTPDARTVTAGSYTVQSGDTLRRIADMTGAGSEAIARANNLAPPYQVQPGQRLVIPAGRYHLVRAGETGIAIARAYGIDWGRVVTANHLAEPYVLRVGQRVLIPGGQSRPPSAAERAAAFRLDIDDLITGSQPVIAADRRPIKPTTSPTRPIPSAAQVATPSAAPSGFVWPVAGGTISRRFGPGASGERNNGVKIAVPLGTPILAAADGVVAYAGSEVAAFGGLVMITHGGGLTSVYGHAGRLLVTRGQKVTRGQRIALSGASGFADRPQLHFEIRQGRRPLDPLTRLPPR